jgi:hypothetical protein
MFGYTHVMPWPFNAALVFVGLALLNVVLAVARVHLRARNMHTRSFDDDTPGNDPGL